MQVGDANERSKAIRLVGNALDNMIFGGMGKDTLYGGSGDDYLVGNAGNDKIYGQNGNDTLWGGIGNDTLVGGTGSDTFIYNANEGKDVILGFDNDDMLQITGNWTATVTSAGNISFKVGSTYNSVVLKSFSATNFNINGETYEISGKKLVKQG